MRIENDRFKMKLALRGFFSLLCLVVVATSTLAAEIPSDKELTNSIGMKLVRIEAGDFVMGSGKTGPTSEAEWKQRDWDESPQHKAKITKPYFLGTTEVTNAQYEQFDPAHKKLRGLSKVSKSDDEPVTMVTWKNAVDFCAWLSKKEGRPYRLPTEAQWEYACRAGTTTRFNTGQILSVEKANMGLDKDGKKKIRTVPVGSYPPNAWGLYDMHGNVSEWCSDWYGKEYYGKSPGENPLGPSAGVWRVLRGGGWFLNASYCRSAYRNGIQPTNQTTNYGFRVACVVGVRPR